MCPPDLFKGTGQGVKVTIVLMTSFPQVQNDSRWTTLCSKIRQIPRQMDLKKQRITKMKTEIKEQIKIILRELKMNCNGYHSRKRRLMGASYRSCNCNKYPSNYKCPSDLSH